MKPPQSYSFRSIYPRVHTKITPNNFRFIILNPTQRTSKSTPRFLPEKQRQERASTPMHRLPQCHLGNLRVECQNIHQVTQSLVQRGAIQTVFNPFPRRHLEPSPNECGWLSTYDTRSIIMKHLWWAAHHKRSTTKCRLWWQCEQKRVGIL